MMSKLPRTSCWIWISATAARAGCSSFANPKAGKRHTIGLHAPTSIP